MAAIASGTAAGVGAWRWRRPLVRVMLLVAALAFLWLAQRRYVAWLADWRSFQSHALGWFTWILAAAGAGFCFAIAAFLRAGRVTFRPLQSMVLALLPVLGILHFAAVVLWRWDLPDVLMRSYFYLDLVPQALLAALVGVALAAGIRGVQDASVPQEPD